MKGMELDGFFFASMGIREINKGYRRLELDTTSDMRIVPLEYFTTLHR